MSLTVQERGLCVATFRAVNVKLMEMLAQWIPTTPEMEVKLLLGTHVWDAAQHADAFGRRTHELRLPLQHSVPPEPDYARLLDEIAGAAATERKIAAMYDALLPRLDARLREYLAATDRVMDGPTVRIVETVLHDHERMQKECRELREALPAARASDPTFAEELARREAAIPRIVTPAKARDAA
jgi:hypothetical protein